TADVDTTSEGSYVMASYKISPWLTPAVYYSLYYPNIDTRSGLENVQHDISVTLRFDLTPSWLIKLEGHAMIGTAVLPARMNADPEPYWGFFLVKTTAYF
ncbi:MAG: hypothetical protein R3C68_15010, partial [Myxococcota bacterium]